MTNLQTSLIVEAHLDRARIVGLLPNLTQNRRLVDILGNQDATFELEWAEACLSGGSERYGFKATAVKKTDLLYAIPRETDEQVKSRALYRTGMSNQALESLAVGVLFSTCHIAGTALLPPGMNRQKLDVASFPRFFAISGAIVTQADGTTTSEQVVVVNGQAILAIGRPAD